MAVAEVAPAQPPDQLLRQLEFTVIRKLDGLLQGDYRTLWRGAGMDLADLREYQAHDDVRHIDWNVTARLQTPHVRQYHEDRDMNAWFLLDLSGSVNFGSADVTKLAVSAGFVATLARVITRHGNRVGALLYGAQVHGMLPARSSRLHVLELLQRMRAPQPRAAAAGAAVAAAAPAATGTALAELLHAAEAAIKRRALVFVVSDFISQPGWQPALARLARRHDVVAVRLWDPLEMALPADPDVGLVTLEDAETGEQVFVDASDPGLRERYAALAEAQETQLLQHLADSGADVLELATDDDLLDTLMRFADLRKQRARLKAPLRFPATMRRATLMTETAP
ncbi:ATPase [beta proteobacterium AAP51]|nr:ATPase [beta proteobacterium AAP51]